MQSYVFTVGSRWPAAGMRGYRIARRQPDASCGRPRRSRGHPTRGTPAPRCQPRERRPRGQSGRGRDARAGGTSPPTRPPAPVSASGPPTRRPQHCVWWGGRVPAPSIPARPPRSPPPLPTRRGGAHPAGHPWGPPSPAFQNTSCPRPRRGGRGGRPARPARRWRYPSPPLPPRPSSAGSPRSKPVGGGLRLALFFAWSPPIGRGAARPPAYGRRTPPLGHPAAAGSPRRRRRVTPLPPGPTPSALPTSQPSAARLAARGACGRALEARAVATVGAGA